MLSWGGSEFAWTSAPILGLGLLGAMLFAVLIWQERRAPDPVLPHPRAHLRLFVLVPLHDVAPAWVHPACRVKASDLCRRLLLDHPPSEVPDPI